MKRRYLGFETLFTVPNLIKKGRISECCQCDSSSLFYRLQVAVAKIQQALPEYKRDGSNVLASLCSQLLYDEDSVSRSGGILSQMEFIPQLARRLQEEPEKVIADLEEVRRHCMWESHSKPALTNNISDRSIWCSLFRYRQCSESRKASQYLGEVFWDSTSKFIYATYNLNNVIASKEGPLSPVPLAVAELSDVGKDPGKKVTVEWPSFCSFLLTKFDRQ